MIDNIWAAKVAKSPEKLVLAAVISVTHNIPLSLFILHVQQVWGVWYEIKKVYFCIVLIKTA